MDDYPFLELVLTMLWIYVLIAWFWFLITLMSDAIRSRDLSGPAKAAWVVGLLFLPVISAIAYLVMRGDSMAERRLQDLQAQRGGGPAHSSADELAKLAALRDSGTLTEEEFAAQKTRILST